MPTLITKIKGFFLLPLIALNSSVASLLLKEEEEEEEEKEEKEKKERKNKKKRREKGGKEEEEILKAKKKEQRGRDDADSVSAQPRNEPPGFLFRSALGGKGSSSTLG